MPYQTMPRRGRSRSVSPVPILALVLVLLTVATAAVFAVKLAGAPSDPPIPGTSEQTDTPSGETTSLPGSTAPDQTDPESTAAPDTLPPATTKEPDVPPPVTYTDITFLSAGDIMFHNANVKAGMQADGSYSYLKVFGYLNEIVSSYDYAVANLETTLSGTDYPYTQSGTISFNAPDAAIDAFKAAGFDTMLFANNHTNDCRLPGIKRTVKVLRDNGIDVIGASDDSASPKWRVVDIKGVKVGMLNYTNDGSWGTAANGTLNGTNLRESADYVNVFYLGKMDAFYASVEADLRAMKEAGADLTVFYIHWGPEYYVEPMKNTKEIAQKLCDMGVDAIIGSHPHVVQPMETLTSSVDPEHHTVCFYSLGNLISNQNRLTLSADYCKGNNVNTENGLMVVLKIRKASTGQTEITGIETIPTWVHRYKKDSGVLDYRIIPLEKALANPEAYGLDDSSFGRTHAKEAFAMTSDLIDGAVQAFHDLTCKET